LYTVPTSNNKCCRRRPRHHSKWCSFLAEVCIITVSVVINNCQCWDPFPWSHVVRCVEMLDCCVCSILKN